MFELLVNAFGGNRLDHETARSAAPCVKRAFVVGGQEHYVHVGIDAKQRVAQIQSIRLAGLTLFMGWNPKDSKNTYLLCDIVSCDLGDIYKNAIVSDEYLEIAQGYVERMGKQLAIAKEFRGKRNLPVQMLGMKHCRKRDEKESLVGNLIILKPESAERQPPKKKTRGGDAR